MIERAIPKAPRHLNRATRAWFDHVAGRFEMEEHHVRLLTLAGEAWDRGVQARQALSEHGLTFVDKYDCPRPRPEVAIERDSRMAFAKLLKELALDAALTPAAPLKSTRKYA